MRWLSWTWVSCCYCLRSFNIYRWLIFPHEVVLVWFIWIIFLYFNMILGIRFRNWRIREIFTGWIIIIRRITLFRVFNNVNLFSFKFLVFSSLIRREIPRMAAKRKYRRLCSKSRSKWSSSNRILLLSLLLLLLLL